MQKHIEPQLFLFAGPTLHSIEADLYSQSTVVLRQPARRGDIDFLVQDTPPGHIAIVDGTFHAYPAVGHAELMQALHLGWKLWGLCSLGAIRAAEMRSFGMIGYGEVYKEFLCDDLTDDEVTLIHQEDSPYTPISEPMIHIRRLLAHLADSNMLPREAAKKITSDFRRRWYGHRTLSALAESLCAHGMPETVVMNEMQGINGFRIKTHDLRNFLSERPWATKSL